MNLSAHDKYLVSLHELRKDNCSDATMSGGTSNKKWTDDFGRTDDLEE